MEINELAAAAQKATGKERRALLLDLWERVKGILYMKARRFWSAHRNSCTARGVELPDVESIAWEVFLPERLDLDSKQLFTSQGRFSS